MGGLRSFPRIIGVTVLSCDSTVTLVGEDNSVAVRYVGSAAGRNSCTFPDRVIESPTLIALRMVFELVKTKRPEDMLVLFVAGL